MNTAALLTGEVWGSVGLALLAAVILIWASRQPPNSDESDTRDEHDGEEPF